MSTDTDTGADNNTKTLVDGLLKRAAGRKPEAKALNLTFFNECCDLKPKRWIIIGVLAKDERSSWYGPPKSIKSGLLLDAAVHACADGVAQWREFRVKERVGAVYFALERADLQRRRLTAYAARDGYTDLPIAIAGDLINLLDPSCVDIIVMTVRAAEERFGIAVGLIIIDTVSKGIAAGGGDEDKAKDQNTVAANMKLIQERLPGVHIAGVGHTGKDESRGERGSNARLADVDAAIQLSGGGDIRTAMVVGANDQPSGPLTAFKMETVAIGLDEEGDKVEVGILSSKVFACSEEGGTSDRLTPNQKTMFSILHDAGASGLTLERWNELAREAGLGTARKASLHDYRTALKAKGLIMEAATGSWIVKPAVQGDGL
jgi:hypothetical protein